MESPDDAGACPPALVRALITEIVADVDETAGEIVLVIHWTGGQHSQLRIKKPKTGEHDHLQSRSGHRRIAETNGNAPGQGKTWTAHRLGSLRRVHSIHGHRPAEQNGDWLTLRGAAAKFGISHHQIRRLIASGVLIIRAQTSPE